MTVSSYVALGVVLALIGWTWWTIYHGPDVYK